MDALGNMQKQIEKLRKQMINVAEKHGRVHPSCIAISRELDELLNKYEKEKEKRNEMECLSK